MHTGTSDHDTVFAQSVTSALRHTMLPGNDLNLHGISNPEGELLPDVACELQVR